MFKDFFNKKYLIKKGWIRMDKDCYIHQANPEAKHSAKEACIIQKRVDLADEYDAWEKSRELITRTVYNIRSKRY